VKTQNGYFQEVLALPFNEIHSLDLNIASYKISMKVFHYIFKK